MALNNIYHFPHTICDFSEDHGLDTVSLLFEHSNLFENYTQIPFLRLTVSSSQSEAPSAGFICISQETLLSCLKCVQYPWVVLQGKFWWTERSIRESTFSNDDILRPGGSYISQECIAEPRLLAPPHLQGRRSASELVSTTNFSHRVSEEVRLASGHRQIPNLRDMTQ